MTTKNDMTKDLTVYYDGSCPLCSAEIRLYANGHGADRIDFQDVAAPSTKLPSGLTREAAMARFHVASKDGTLSSGAAGFFELWSNLPRWRILARLGKIPGVIPIAELAYRGFLVIRPFCVALFTWVSRATTTRSQKED